MQPDPAAECLVQLVQQLGLPIARRRVYEELHRHPDHPSLLAFSDVLHSWGVPNGAYKVAGDELPDLPTPFLAHTAGPGGGFRLVRQAGASGIVAGAPPQRPTAFTPAEFGQVFTGHVLLAEPAADKAPYRQHRRRERLAALRRPLLVTGGGLLGLLAVAQSAVFQAPSWHLLALLAAKSGGLLLAVLLLAQSLGHHNPLLQRLCAGGPRRSCHAILASRAARLTEGLSWAEVGFFYFAGTWLALLLAPDPVRLLPGLALLSLLGLPFTAYSLYYQARVARQWCVLCCAVLAVLWVEFLVSCAYLSWPLPRLSVAQISTLLGGLLAPVVGWALLKSLLTRAQEADTLRQQLGAFKRNQRLFEHALAGQLRHELLPPADAIRLGNPAARHIITVITSPTCPPCARAHAVLDEWLTRRDDVQVQVVFTVPNDPQEVDYQAAAHLMALRQHQPAAVQEALHTWYAQDHKDYAAWAKRYPTAPATPDTGWLPQHLAWCRRAGVSATPTILLNGQRLPEYYQVEDIKYFL